MIPKLHPAVFLGAVVVLCAAWLWVRPPVSAVETVPRSAPRLALVESASIELDRAILERYVGTYQGRGGLTIELTLKEGKLLAQTAGSIPTIPFELRATSETEFFVRGPSAPVGVNVEFDVARDGTVRGFAADTELGLIEVKRVR